MTYDKPGLTLTFLQNLVSCLLRQEEKVYVTLEELHDYVRNSSDDILSLIWSPIFGYPFEKRGTGLISPTINVYTVATYISTTRLDSLYGGKKETGTCKMHKSCLF